MFNGLVHLCFEHRHCGLLFLLKGVSIGGEVAGGEPPPPPPPPLPEKSRVAIKGFLRYTGKKTLEKQSDLLRNTLIAKKGVARTHNLTDGIYCTRAYIPDKFNTY